MTKDIAQSLSSRATEIASIYSDPARTHNPVEKFDVEKILPLSEFTAAVVFRKNTEKRVVGFFYYVRTGSGGRWYDFFPTDSHIIGMASFGRLKQEIEETNYPKNFD